MDNYTDSDPLNFEKVILKLFTRFQNHTFYAYLIQSVLIFYAYVRGVGRNGNFWRIIYFGSLAALIGAVITETCEILMEGDPKNASDILYYILIVHEIFYAIRNLVLPYINMVKVLPLLDDKGSKRLKIFIGVMTVVHFIQRFYIGIIRYQERDITMESHKLLRQYGVSVITISLTDIVCSMVIIKKLVENYNIAIRRNLKISVYKFFFQSALFILIFVDFFSLIIGILTIVNSQFLKEIFIPLYGLNCNVILLLAFDALVFKNDIMVNVNNEFEMSQLSEETFANDIVKKNKSRCHCCTDCGCRSHCSSYFSSHYDSNSNGPSPSEAFSHCHQYNSQATSLICEHVPIEIVNNDIPEYNKMTYTSNYYSMLEKRRSNISI